MPNTSGVVEPVQVLRYFGRLDDLNLNAGNFFATIKSLDELAGFVVLPWECIIAPHVPGALGYRELIMLRGVELKQDKNEHRSMVMTNDKVRISATNYYRLKRAYMDSGAKNPNTDKLASDIDRVLALVANIDHQDFARLSKYMFINFV